MNHLFFNVKALITPLIKGGTTPLMESQLSSISTLPFRTADPGPKATGEVYVKSAECWYQTRNFRVEKLEVFAKR